MTTDAELISWSLVGDGDAFVELVRRHEGAVWSYLVRRAGRQAAEDLLGEVWVAAFGARARYDRAFPSARPWLFGIAGNVLRRSWRDRPAAAFPIDAETDGEPPSEDPWPTQDERIHGAALLRDALTRLSPEQREVLCLVVWEELRVAEAARALEIPSGTARRLLHEARLTLRDVPELRALATPSTAKAPAKTTASAKEHR
ncbi:MAG: RNA polymerase sigma factor [Acidimicrobiales bacterium]